MSIFTVILGDFSDFPGVFNEYVVEANDVNAIDMETVADKVYEELCNGYEDEDEELCNDLHKDVNVLDRGPYTLVGVYEGDIKCVRGGY